MACLKSDTQKIKLIPFDFSYLEGRSIKVFHRELAAMEGGNAHDVYQTTQGMLWHRIDYPSFETAEPDDEQF